MKAAETQDKDEDKSKAADADTIAHAAVSDHDDIDGRCEYRNAVVERLLTNFLKKHLYLPTRVSQVSCVCRESQRASAPPRPSSTSDGFDVDAQASMV